MLLKVEIGNTFLRMLTFYIMKSQFCCCPFNHSRNYGQLPQNQWEKKLEREEENEK